ncbi:hypothetical protein JCM12296A_57120 [Desulfosarcina cetonica]
MVFNVLKYQDARMIKKWLDNRNELLPGDIFFIHPFTPSHPPSGAYDEIEKDH